MKFEDLTPLIDWEQSNLPSQPSQFLQAAFPGQEGNASTAPESIPINELAYSVSSEYPERDDREHVGMNRCSAIVLAIGICLAASGCGCCGARRCSNCTPPWVPCFKYCQCVDDIVVWETAKNCGLRALARYKRQCGGPVGCHFAAGFVQAYIDLAEGRGPLPPAVPPSRYWTAYYRSCAGEPKVEQWYAGYNAGLQDGLEGGVSKFNRIDVRLAGQQ